MKTIIIIIKENPANTKRGLWDLPGVGGGGREGGSVN